MTRYRMFFILLPLAFLLLILFMPNVSASTLDAASLTLEVGADLEGSIEDLAVNASGVVSVSELAGVTDCLVLRVDYLLPDYFFNLSMSVLGYYEGNPAHELALQIYNYSSAGWQTIIFMADSDEAAWFNSSYTSGYLDFVSNGNFSVRFYHADSGVEGHMLHLDTILVEVDEGATISFTVNNGGRLAVNGSFVGNETVFYASGSGVLLSAYPDANFTFNGFTVDGVVNASNPLAAAVVNGSLVVVDFVPVVGDLSVDDAVALAVALPLIVFGVCVAIVMFRSKEA